MLTILNRNQEPIGILSNDMPKACPYFEDTHIQALENSLSLYEFKVPANHPSASLLEVEGYIVFADMDKKKHLFQIKEINQTRNGLEVTKQIYCENSAVSDLNGEIVRPIIMNSYTLHQAMEYALANTDWKLGRVDFVGVKDFEIKEHMTSLEALHTISKEFGAELEYEVIFNGTKIVERYIHVLDQRGQETGKVFTYEKDIVGVERVEDTRGLVTALIGVGKGQEDGTLLTFDSYIAPNDERYVKTNDFIADMEAYQRFNKNGRHIFGVFKDDQATTQVQLFDNTLAKLKELSKPKLTYRVSVVLLEKLTGYAHEKVRIGDRIAVQDKSFSPMLLLEARVIDIKRSETDPSADEVTLGDYVPLAITNSTMINRLQQTIFRNETQWNKAYNDAQQAIKDASDVNTKVDNIEIGGRNLWVIKDEIQGMYGTNDGVMTLGGAYKSTPLLPVQPNEQYVINKFTGNYYSRVYFYDSNQAFISRYPTQESPHLITIPVNAYYVAFTVESAVAQVKLEKGNKATDYTPSPEDVEQDALDKANTAEGNAKGYTDSKLTGYVDVTTHGNDINALQNQIDGNITSWFYNYDPTLTNAPASTWTTNTDKDNHVGDLFYNNTSGYGWRFAKDSATGAYSWVAVKDTDIQKALTDASNAQDTADNKRRVFVTTPIPPYDLGDLWANGQKVYRATVAKASGTAYAFSDWQLIGDVTSQNTSADTAKVNGTPANEMETQTGSQAKVNAVKIGGRNLARLTGTAKTLTGAGTNNNTVSFYDINSEILSGNQEYTVSFDWELSADTIFATGGANNFYLQLKNVVDTSNATHWDSISATIPVSATAMSGHHSEVRSNLNIAFTGETFTTQIRMNYVTGTLTIKNFKIELGNKETSWTPAVEDINSDIQKALSDASTAQSTADGKITSFYQDSAPTTGMSEGDIWFDTNDGNKVYIYQGGSWVSGRDSGIATALGNASTAQATADKKVQTFFSSTTPTAESIGDLWYNTTTFELKRWDNTTWNVISDITSEKTAKDTANVNGTPASEMETQTGSQAKVDAVQVGGRNLIPNSSVSTTKDVDGNIVADLTDWSTFNTGSTNLVAGTGRLDDFSAQITASQSNAGMRTPKATKVVAGKEYTASVWIKQSTAGSVGFLMKFRDSAGVESNPISTTSVSCGANEWVRVVTTFIMPSTAVEMDLTPRTLGGTYPLTLWADDVQLEEGNKATDWTPAIEDTQQQIDLQANTISLIDQRTDNDSITNTVMTHTNFTDAMGLKVDQNHLTTNYDTKTGVDTKIGNIDHNAKIDARMEDYKNDPASMLNTTFTTKTELQQTEQAIDAKFSKGGGVNLLKNSVGYADFDFWTETGDTARLEIVNNLDLDNMGYGSGFHVNPNASGTLNTYMTQDVPVTVGQPYTLSWVVNKTNNSSSANSDGAIWIQIQEDGVTTESYSYASNKVTQGYEENNFTFTPTSATITVRLAMYKLAECTWTGLMLNVGSLPLQWTMARDEVYNANVKLNANGIKVLNSVYEGYTHISPEEFAGYAEVDGAMQKVFTLNKDVTEVSKLNADNEMTMTPIKIVPIRSGGYNGWAWIKDV